MNFFGRQESAKRDSRLLVVLFFFAVLAAMAVTYIFTATVVLAFIKPLPNVGKVQTYERYTQQQSKLADFYKDATSGRLLGWNIRRVATREAYVDIGRWVVDHDWKIRGYMALDDADATEQTFDTLVESIRTVFRDDPSMGDLIFNTVIDEKNNQAGVQVEEAVPVLFAGVLCHSARLGLTTRHLI